MPHKDSWATALNDIISKNLRTLLTGDSYEMTAFITFIHACVLEKTKLKLVALEDVGLFSVAIDNQATESCYPVSTVSELELTMAVHAWVASRKYHTRTVEE